VKELGDSLTPPQVVKMVRDAARLIFEQPQTWLDPASGVEAPFPADKRSEIAEAFLDGSVARLSQWWRAGDEPQVAAVVNELDADMLRMLAVSAIAKLGEVGWTIAKFPDLPSGVDPSTN
jgi:hypothetical protein